MLISNTNINYSYSRAKIVQRNDKNSRNKNITNNNYTCILSSILPIVLRAKLNSKLTLASGTLLDAGIKATVPRLEPPNIWLSTGR